VAAILRDDSWGSLFGIDPHACHDSLGMTVALMSNQTDFFKRRSDGVGISHFGCACQGSRKFI
jgi:hypothetical protein